MLPIHGELSKVDLNKTQMDFDGTSLYPSATLDQNSAYPKIGTGYAYKLQINDVFGNDSNKSNF